MADENEDYVITWEAPVIEVPEFRLYFDDKGKVLCYTCEKLEGDYIVIDSLTFAEARPDVRVVDGKLVRAGTTAVVAKLHPSDEGTLCETEDVSVISETTGQHWKLKIYEL